MLSTCSDIFLQFAQWWGVESLLCVLWGLWVNTNCDPLFLQKGDKAVGKVWDKKSLSGVQIINLLYVCALHSVCSIKVLYFSQFIYYVFACITDFNNNMQIRLYKYVLSKAVWTPSTSEWPLFTLAGPCTISALESNHNPLIILSVHCECDINKSQCPNWCIGFHCFVIGLGHKIISPCRETSDCSVLNTKKYLTSFIIFLFYFIFKLSCNLTLVHFWQLQQAVLSALTTIPHSSIYVYFYLICACGNKDHWLIDWILFTVIITPQGSTHLLVLVQILKCKSVIHNQVRCKQCH